jgi:hypothetical protein
MGGGQASFCPDLEGVFHVCERSASKLMVRRHDFDGGQDEPIEDANIEDHAG